MNNRSHELAAETQVTALLPASTLNTNAWMLTLLWTSIQTDKQRESERDREKMATEGSWRSSIITTVFRSTCTVSYYYSNRRALKGLMKSSQSQGPEQSASDPWTRWINDSSKRNKESTCQKNTWEVWSITAVTAETCLPFLLAQQLSDRLYNSFREELNFTV